MGGCRWVDAIGLHKEGACGGAEVNQWHKGFGDCRVDEVFVGRAVLGASLAMWYRVRHGLSRGGIVLDDGDG